MEVEENEVVDWLELPNHISLEIMGKLTCSFDYARFGAVCVKWRSLFLNEEEEEECPKLPPQLPLLIVPTTPKEEEEEDTKSCSLYRNTDEKLYNRLQLRVPCDRHFRGSGHGWLVAVDDDELSHYPIQLINPFFLPHPKVIPLPPLTTFPSDEEDLIHNCYYFRKAVLSADPISNPKDYMVMMAIYGGFTRLALFKLGQDDTDATTWTPVHYDGFKGLFEDVIYYLSAWNPVHYDGFKGLFEDVIYYYKDKFYAVHYYGAVVVCDVESCTAKKVVGPPIKGIECSRKYLVESGGDLLQVHRYVDSQGLPSYSTTAFKVFKLSLDPTGSSEPQWMEVKDLCDRLLFVGHNASLSISASHFPGCKTNCIYYTDDHIETYYFDQEFGPHDMGVFNLGNNSFEKHYPTEIGTPIWPAPIWIEPVLPRRCFNTN